MAPPLPQTPFLSPLILSTHLGPFNSVGADLTADGMKFRNPNRTPMLVDQIRFSGAVGAFSASIAIEVRLGSIPLTKGPVTLATLAPQYLGTAGGFAASATTYGPSADAILVWHLPKPLFVPPGIPLIIRAVRQALYQGSSEPGNTSRLGITVVGRSLPFGTKTPVEIVVPWVAETRCNNRTSPAANRFVSLDSDLANPHSTPLHVHQFIGFNADALSENLSNPAALTCQMTASNGLMFIRDPVPFFVLFPTERGILNVDAQLQAGEFFRAELEIASLPTGAASGQDRIEFSSIAMHGYRRIPTPQGVAVPTGFYPLDEEKVKLSNQM